MRAGNGAAYLEPVRNVRVDLVYEANAIIEHGHRLTGLQRGLFREWGRPSVGHNWNLGSGFLLPAKLDTPAVRVPWLFMGDVVRIEMNVTGGT